MTEESVVIPAPAEPGYEGEAAAQAAAVNVPADPERTCSGGAGSIPAADPGRTYSGAEVETLLAALRADGEKAAAKAADKIAALEARLADEASKRAAESRLARCGEALRRAGLPDSLSAIACAEDDDVTAANVEMLRAAVEKAVRAEIVSRVGQSVPLSGTYGHLSKADIRRLPLSALQEIAGD